MAVRSSPPPSSSVSSSSSAPSSSSSSVREIYGIRAGGGRGHRWRRRNEVLADHARVRKKLRLESRADAATVVPAAAWGNNAGLTATQKRGTNRKNEEGYRCRRHRRRRAGSCGEWGVPVAAFDCARVVIRGAAGGGRYRTRTVARCTPGDEEEIATHRQAEEPADAAGLAPAPVASSNANTAAIVRVGANIRYSDKDLLLDILKLAVPCLGVALADPLMSLIDTGCVGRVSTIGLAALGPNTAIFNTVFQVCVFWGTATTNFVAGASPVAAGISVDERSRRREKGAEVLSSALSMAFFKGMLMWFLLYKNGEFLLRLMGANEELIGPALSYFNVRVAAAPAVLVTMVAQGACMGQQDAVSPLIVVLASAFVNLLGDYYLVIKSNLGVYGAAVATIASQYMQAVIFLMILFVRGRLNKVSAIPLKWCGLPKVSLIARFAEVAGVLASRTILQMMTYALLTYTIIAMGDNRLTASHQVALQIFWLMSYFPEPLSVCAQTFIAKDISMPLKVHRTSWLLMKIGFALGFLIFGVSYATATFFCGAFSADASIVALTSQLGMQIGIAAGLVSVTMVLDGILIGSSDFRLMPVIGGVSTGVVLMMLRHCMGNGVGLNGIWWSLTVFFGCRVLLNVCHVVLNLGRRKSPLLKPQTSPSYMIASYN